MRLLLDEMYPSALADDLRKADIDAVTVVNIGFAGRPDPDVFAAAIEHRRAILTENVGDFTRIAAEHLGAGRHHPGVLIALASRFSRRPAGRPHIVRAIQSLRCEILDDRVIYLKAEGACI